MMDQCNYCHEYHHESKVCSEYVEAVGEGKVVMDQDKFEKAVNDEAEKTYSFDETNVPEDWPDVLGARIDFECGAKWAKTYFEGEIKKKDALIYELSFALASHNCNRPIGLTRSEWSCPQCLALAKAKGASGGE